MPGPGEGRPSWSEQIITKCLVPHLLSPYCTAHAECCALLQAALAAPMGVRAKASTAARNQMLLQGMACMVAADACFALWPSAAGGVASPPCTAEDFGLLHVTSLLTCLPVLQASAAWAAEASPAVTCLLLLPPRHGGGHPAAGRSHGHDPRHLPGHAGGAHPLPLAARAGARGRHLLVPHRPAAGWVGEQEAVSETGPPPAAVWMALASACTLPGCCGVGMSRRLHGGKVWHCRCWAAHCRTWLLVCSLPVPVMTPELHGDAVGHANIAAAQFCMFETPPLCSNLPTSPGVVLAASNWLAGRLSDATAARGLGGIGCFAGGAVATALSMAALLGFSKFGDLGKDELVRETDYPTRHAPQPAKPAPGQAEQAAATSSPSPAT